MSYPADPNYEQHVASIPAEFRTAIAPVVPTIEVDRSRWSPQQRVAHDGALRSVAYADQPVEPLGRDGFTTRIGTACVRDNGG